MQKQSVLFHCSWKAVNSHIFSTALLCVKFVFLLFICQLSASLHRLAQAKEDDGNDPERKGAHRCGESPSHWAHPHGNEGEVRCWEPAGQDVRDTVSFTCHINKQVKHFKWQNQVDVARNVDWEEALGSSFPLTTEERKFLKVWASLVLSKSCRELH